MWPRGYLVILSLVAGTAVLMWIGELISQRGIGNGMSMVIFASVVSSLPFGYYAILAGAEVVRVRPARGRQPADRRRRRARRAGATPHPGAVRQASCRPADVRRAEHLHPAEGQPERRRARSSSPAPCCCCPCCITNFLGGSNGTGWRATIQKWVDSNLVNSQNLVYILLFSLMIVAFAYFYNSIAFDPIRQADQIRRQGGFIPGVRPGPQTERYLAKAVNRITLPGALFVAVIAITAVHHPVGVRRPELPLRRDHRVDRRGRRARTHASDRQPADAAQLRGLPEVTLPVFRKAGRQRHDPRRSAHPARPARRR